MTRKSIDVNQASPNGTLIAPYSKLESVTIVQLLASLGLPTSIELGADYLVSCNPGLAQTRENSAFQLSREMGILDRNKKKRILPNDV